MSPTPMAEGTLAATPLAHVVLSVHRRKLTGTLAVWPDDERPGQDRVRFENGVPVAGRLLDPAETLERALLPLFRRTRAPFAFYEADLVGSGDNVLAMPCETYALIAAALRGGGRDDVIDAVLHEFGDHAVRLVASFDAAAFRLVPKESTFVDLLSSEPGSVAQLFHHSGDEKTARRVLYLLAITRNLERCPSASMRTSELPGLDSAPSRPTFSPTSPPPASVFAAPRPSGRSQSPPPSESSPRPSAGPPPATPEPSKRPVGSNPPSGTAPRRVRGIQSPELPPAVPSGLSPELAARYTDLATRVVAADTQNFFEVLGIEEAAPPDAVRSAYFEAVKRVHPDRLPPELVSLRSFAERLFQQITEAKETLEDGDKRLKYVRTVREGGGTPYADRRMMAVLSAAYELDKATVLANLGKWAEVLFVLEDAKALDASQPDIYALEAWALFHLLGHHPNATLENVLALTERVIADAADHYHERALYTRGLVLKRQNRNDEAVGLFKRIAERNPRHLDAAREVRLHGMRHSGKSSEGTNPAPSKDGLLSKLFGGKK